MGRIRVLDTDPVLFMIQWLHQTVPAGIRVGDDRESGHLPYVTVRSDGGNQTLPWTTTAALGINVWAETDQQAQELALELRSWIEFATTHELCQAAVCSMPFEVAVDSSAVPQRYLVVQLTLSQRLPAGSVTPE